MEDQTNSYKMGGMKGHVAEAHQMRWVKGRNPGEEIQPILMAGTQETKITANCK